MSLYLSIYKKANNKYMNDYDENKESSYIKYWGVNNLYGLEMSQKLPVNKLAWIKGISQLNEMSLKNYIEESHEGHSLEVDIQYLEKLHELHNDLLFLPDRMKIENIENLVADLHDKTEYVIHIRTLKQTWNPWLVSKKVHRVIKFNQNTLKPYVNMNRYLTKNAKNDFEKDFFKLMNNPVFGETIENARRHRYIKLATTERRKNYIVWEPNYILQNFSQKVY